MLNPRNIAWLMGGGDSQSQYFGWAFFRHSLWTFPLGLNPRFGLELGSSILYTDSVPLLALPVKALSPLLPEPFQYFGIWLLACFILQALLASVLIGLVTPHASLRLLASALFVFAPPMLFRLAGHWALVGHWTILAALVLVLRPDRGFQTLLWTLLSACTALVQPYLLVMVAALWLSAWTADAWLGRRTHAALAREAVVVPAAVFFVLWQVGFFAVGEGISKTGFGAFRFNLNSPINAYGWSRVLPTLEWGPTDYEGFAFLGLGMLVLAALAIPALFAMRARKELRFHPKLVPLGLSLAALTAFAMSNHVGLGQHTVSYFVPESLERVVGILRSSGRLVWPAFYVVYAAVIAVIVRGYPVRLSGAALATALVLQILDTAPGWGAYGPQLRERGLTRSPLVSGFWYQAPDIYSRVRLIPPGNAMENWSVFAAYADRADLSTDSVYCDRVDGRRAGRLLERTASMLLKGDFDLDTLYILQGGAARRVPCIINSDSDQLALIDGFWVLMPGWKTRFGERFAGQIRLNCPPLSTERAPLAFIERSEAIATLVGGWSAPEDWGTWSEGPRSTLVLRLEGRLSGVELLLDSVRRPGRPLEVNVSIDGQSSGTWRMSEELGPHWYRVAVPDTETVAARRLSIGFSYSDVRSPASLGDSMDERHIAIALLQARAVR